MKIWKRLASAFLLIAISFHIYIKGRCNDLQCWPKSHCQKPTPLLFWSWGVLIRFKIFAYRRFRLLFKLLKPVLHQKSHLAWTFCPFSKSNQYHDTAEKKCNSGSVSDFPKNLTPAPAPVPKQTQISAGVDSGHPGPWPPLISCGEWIGLLTRQRKCLKY